jgi:hypothetical protein
MLRVSISYIEDGGKWSIIGILVSRGKHSSKFKIKKWKILEKQRDTELSCQHFWKGEKATSTSGGL